MTQFDDDSPVGVGGDGVEARLLDAASELFAERGYAAVGIREIAKRAGVTVGALYHYAASKEMLLVNLLRRSYARLMPQIEGSVPAQLTPAERIRSLTRAHILIEVAQRDLWRVSRAELNLLSPLARKEVVSLRDQFEMIWDRVIDDGLAAGDFVANDARLVRLCLVEMCNGVGTWFRENGRLSLDQIIDKITENALLMLGSKANSVSNNTQPATDPASTPASASACSQWPPASGTTPTPAHPENDHSSPTTTDQPELRTQSSKGRLVTR